MTDPLKPEEIDRYRRHIVLAEIGGAGPPKAKGAEVLGVGARRPAGPGVPASAPARGCRSGGPAPRCVSLSNLQRQVIHDTAGIGTAKIASAEAAVARLNPHVAFTGIAERLAPESAARLLSGYDLLVDGSDNFDTRYASADAAQAARIPLVTGAVGRFDGSVTVLKPYEAGPDGTPNPGYRDLFPAAPPPGVVPACAEAGIVGALTGVIGTLMAMEVIKLVTGAGEPLVGRLLLYDGLAARFETLRYRRRKS